MLHSTPVYETMRENRNLFLHKGSWHKFKGYAYSQLSKLEGKANRENPKRAADIVVYGYDTKFAYHIVIRSRANLNRVYTRFGKKFCCVKSYSQWRMDS